MLIILISSFSHLSASGLCKLVSCFSFALFYSNEDIENEDGSHIPILLGIRVLYPKYFVMPFLKLIEFH